MKSTTRKLLIAGLAGVSLFSATAVIASGSACDGSSSPRFGMGGHGMMERGHGGPSHTSFNPQERAERHLVELKAALKLQPSQEAAWSTFAAAAQAQAKAMNQARDEMHDKTLTTPGRMELALKFAKEREQGMDQVAQAMRILYETLAPEQRKVLDQQHDGHARGHRMHG